MKALVKITYCLLFVALMAITTSCSKSSDPAPDVPSPQLTAAQSYYDASLKSILTSKCTRCHSEYSNFAGARTDAAVNYTVVNNGAMPKEMSKLADADIAKFLQFKTLVAAIP